MTTKTRLKSTEQALETSKLCNSLGLLLVTLEQFILRRLINFIYFKIRQNNNDSSSQSNNIQYSPKVNNCLSSLLSWRTKIKNQTTCLNHISHFHANVLFLYPLKLSEKQRSYRKAYRKEGIEIGHWYEKG